MLRAKVHSLAYLNQQANELQVQLKSNLDQAQLELREKDREVENFRNLNSKLERAKNEIEK